MAHRVELAFRRAADRLLPRGSAVVAAVSGGGDSVALLYLLHRFSVGRSIPITVAHLDHGLRRGSRADRRFVEHLASSLRLPCICERLEVGSLRRRDESPEEAARRVRRQFLLGAAARIGAGRVATGHTLDDQAETVLMRLVRGAGATALTGMAEDGPGPFVRPLLGLERADLRAYLRQRRLPFREDPTNRDLRFDRNRVRRLALPWLSEILNPRAARHLVRAAGLFREDALHMDGLAEAGFRRIARSDPEHGLVVDAAKLARMPPPLGRRLARLVLQRAGGDARRINANHIAALLDLARGAGGRQLHLPGGLCARRIRGLIHVEQRGAP